MKPEQSMEILFLARRYMATNHAKQMRPANALIAYVYSLLAAERRAGMEEAAKIADDEATFKLNSREQCLTAAGIASGIRAKAAQS